MFCFEGASLRPTPTRQQVLVQFLPHAALCRSCTATQLGADSHTAFHTWYTCSRKYENSRHLHPTSGQLTEGDLSCVPPRVTCDRLTFLQSSHTTELTLAEPNCSPHSRQRDIPSPHTVFFMSSRRFINRLQEHKDLLPVSGTLRKNHIHHLSPDSFLLHSLHFLCTGDDAIYDLLLFIGQVWTRTGTRTWFHGPAAPVDTVSILNCSYDLLHNFLGLNWSNTHCSWSLCQRSQIRRKQGK